MTRLAQLFALPLALAAGACSSSFEERYHDALPVEQRLPIEVKSQVTALDLETDAYGRLTARSQSEVAGFMVGFKADSGTVLEIQTAGAGGGAAQTEGEIRDLASIYGVPRNQIRVTGYVPEPGRRPVTRIAYARYVASVPACENPDWSENLAMTWDNNTYETFGCATQQNMAAMAADPRDLVRMRTMDPVTSSEKRDTMMGKYEKGESPSSARTPGDSGKLAPARSGTERQ